MLNALDSLGNDILVNSGAWSITEQVLPVQIALLWVLGINSMNELANQLQLGCSNATHLKLSLQSAAVRIQAETVHIPSSVLQIRTIALHVVWTHVWIVVGCGR